MLGLLLALGLLAPSWALACEGFDSLEELMQHKSKKRKDAHLISVDGDTASLVVDETSNLVVEAYERLVSEHDVTSLLERVQNKKSFDKAALKALLSFRAPLQFLRCVVRVYSPKHSVSKRFNNIVVKLGDLKDHLAHGSATDMSRDATKLLETSLLSKKRFKKMVEAELSFDFDQEAFQSWLEQEGARFLRLSSRKMTRLQLHDIRKHLRDLKVVTQSLILVKEASPDDRLYTEIVRLYDHMGVVHDKLIKLKCQGELQANKKQSLLKQSELDRLRAVLTMSMH